MGKKPLGPASVLWRYRLFFCFYFVSQIAAAQRLDVPMNVGNVYVDTNALKGVCAAGNIEEKSGTLLSVPLPKLAPGAYQVHMRLKISHTGVQATSRMGFTLGVGTAQGPLAQKILTIVDFERAHRYQEFTFPLTLAKAVGNAGLSVSWQWNQSLDPATGNRKLNDMMMPSLTNMEINLADRAENAPLSEAMAINRPLSELPYYLACDSLWLERVGDAVVNDLWVDKSRYAPGETAHLRGKILNCSGEARAWTVRAERIDELDPSGVVASTNVRVEAGQAVEFGLAFPVGNRLWGHEARCSLLDATQGVATVASTPFAVHSNMWAVLLGSKTMDHTDYRAQHIASAGRRGVNDEVFRLATEIEFVFWAPDDFGDLTPTNHYWSGQMRRENGPESTRQLVKYFQDRGVGCAFYAKICTPGGKAGYDLMRRHPEWLSESFFDVGQLDRWDRSQRLSCWPILGVNTQDDDAYRLHAREIIESQRAFGWDALRYDSAMNDPAAPHYFGMVKKMVNDACPGFQWGYNSGHPDGYAPGMFDLMCEGGGLIMEERNVHGGQDGWTYKEYASRHVVWRDEVHPRGGHLTFCPYEPELMNDSIYQQILPLCARAHQAWDVTGGQVVGWDYKRFSLRHAGQLWDIDYKPITNAAAHIDWGAASSNLFLWDHYVYDRAVGPDRRELILHMVNPPPDRIGGSPECSVPDPVEGAVCRIRLPPGVKAGPVQCLSAEQIPEQQELASRQEGDLLVFTVPKLRFWNMLVIPLAGTGRWP
jgi:hypothetical protein